MSSVSIGVIDWVDRPLVVVVVPWSFRCTCYCLLEVSLVMLAIPLALSFSSLLHARTHTQWLVHAGWAVFISIFFILVHLGHGSVRCIIFTHRAFFERATVSTYSHTSRDCLYGSRAGNPSLECFMQMKQFLPSFKRALDCCLALMSRARKAKYGGDACENRDPAWKIRLDRAASWPRGCAVRSGRPVPPVLLYLFKYLSMNTHSFVYILCFHVLRGDSQH